MTRQWANRIRRCLAPQIFLIIDRYQNIKNIESQISFKHDGKWYDLSKLVSRTLNTIIKQNRNKITPFAPGDKFKIDNALFGNIQNTWHNLWLIKNPILRSIRLKILYKDVWTNEKRLKLKMTNDDKCVICGEVETVFHQLFTCSNARRLWIIFKELMGINIPTNIMQFAQFISVSNDYLVEILKA